jgi:hypothetical protein
MANLLDIAPSTSVEVVRINGGGRLKVRGLNANAIASIAARFPKIIGIFLGGFNLAELQQPQMIRQFGEAVAPIIAAGCDQLADEEAERCANNLLLEDQLKLFKAIWSLTFPNGWQTFVEALASLSSADEGAKVVKVRLKRSPSSSPLSSAAVSRPNLQ